MDKKEEVKLTEGSHYRIISIGGRDQMLETEGVFTGFSTLGIDEIGLVMIMSESHGKMQGKTRIVPLHAILAIDILDAKEQIKKEDEKDSSHYYG
jgi:hypothetical protein